MNRRQAIPSEQKYTVKQFQAEFPNDSACLDYLMQKRFPGNIALCVACGINRKHYRVTGRTCYACESCGNHLFPLAGTIFHKSSTSLTTWFYVIKLMTSTRVGVSAKQILRETGVTYKTAWRMMKQVRTLMAERLKFHRGPVEMDEGVFGGSDVNKPQHLRGKAKTTVLGIVERGGRVVARVIPGKSETAIMPVVKDTIWPRMSVYTDANSAYKGLRYLGMSLRHTAVNKTKGYTDGFAHTNSVEGFWSLVKRGIQGVYYQVSADYCKAT